RMLRSIRPTRARRSFLTDPGPQIQNVEVTVHGLRVTVVQKRISLEAALERFRPQEGHWEAAPLNETLPVLSPECKRSWPRRCCRGPSPRTFPAPRADRDPDRPLGTVPPP